MCSAQASTRTTAGGRRPVKKYIEEDMKVNTDRKQVSSKNWEEAALRIRTVGHIYLARNGIKKQPLS